MILIDNVNLLRTRFPFAWKSIDLNEPVDEQKVKVIPSRSSLPTLLFKTKEHEIYVHSKYDPQREAEQIVKSYDLGDYEHVLFYGIGLGYHIEAFLAKYPSISFSLYEPNYDILKTFLSTKQLNTFFCEGLKELFFERFEKDTQENIMQFFTLYDLKKVLVVILPCYERICPENLERFSEVIKEVAKQRKASLNIAANFEKRWISNSLSNLPQILSTPNILHDINREMIQGKPALIISAGPSLQYSIEEVRKIKDNGLAYIFSVGSAIDALLANNIYPDVACTYDPSPQNYKVFKNVVSKGINTIPMIFGSSASFETIQNYPGQKAHMITSQDTVSPMLLKYIKDKEVEKVDDAPSIAVVTLQLLYKLGFNPVYLVGQNLAYLDNKIYSQGIDHDFRPSQLSEQEQKLAIQVEDVDGNKVSTNEGLNRIRITFEQYIKAYAPKLKVINTTKNGAKIEGTQFIPLEEVIKTQLKTKVVKEDWFSGESEYRKDYLLKQMEMLNSDFQTLNKTMELQKKSLEQISNLIKLNENELEQSFAKYEKSFNKMRKNKFYKNILEPMNRVHYQFLAKRIKDIRFERDIIKKGNVIFSEFNKYISFCQNDYEKITPIWESVKEKIKFL